MKSRILSLLCACVLFFSHCTIAYEQDPEQSGASEPASLQETSVPDNAEETQRPESAEDDPVFSDEPAAEASPTPDNKQEPAGADDDGCNTAEELYAFLSAKTGGSITLTGDIVWDSVSGLTSISNITHPAAVEMGEYKITVPAESTMHIEGPVIFQGQGPVLFDVQDSLNLSYGVEIMSTGSGATALTISETSSVSLTYCRVAATGENATAVYSSPLFRQML